MKFEIRLCYVVALCCCCCSSVDYLEDLRFELVHLIDLGTGLVEIAAGVGITETLITVEGP